MMKINILPSVLDNICNEFYTKNKQRIKTNINKYNITGIPQDEINLYNEIENNLEEIIKAKPNEIDDKINIINPLYKKVLTNNTNIKKTILDIFEYDNYDFWDAYGLAQKLNVTVCPYCNRNYTFTLKSKTGKTRPEYDHFYDKATYPYLSLSFYNLIPSCHICNSNLKGSKKFTFGSHINPYYEEFGEKIKFILFYENNQNKELSIKFKYDKDIDLKLKTKAQNNIKVFCLEELYKMHKDVYLDLYEKLQVYSKSYTDFIYKQYPSINSYLTQNSIYNLFFSEYINGDIGKKSLGKMKKDICNQFGINQLTF